MGKRKSHSDIATADRIQAGESREYRACRDDSFVFRTCTCGKQANILH